MLKRGAKKKLTRNQRRVRGFVQKKRWSYRQFGGRIGLNYATIYQICKGNTKVTPPSAKRLALEMPFDWWELVDVV